MLARIVVNNCSKNVLAYQRLGMAAMGQQVGLFERIFSFCTACKLYHLVTLLFNFKFAKM